MIQRLADEQFRHLGVALQRGEVVGRHRLVTITMRRFATKITERFATKVTKITKEGLVWFFLLVSFVRFVADRFFVCFVADGCVAGVGLPVVGRCIRARRRRPSETADHGQRRAKLVFPGCTGRGKRPQGLGKVARCRCLPGPQRRGMRLERSRHGLTIPGTVDDLRARETIQRVIDLGKGALKSHGSTWGCKGEIGRGEENFNATF
jgi:hypothetical protein